MDGLYIAVEDNVSIEPCLIDQFGDVLKLDSVFSRSKNSASSMYCDRGDVKLSRHWSILLSDFMLLIIMK